MEIITSDRVAALVAGGIVEPLILPNGQNLFVHTNPNGVPTGEWVECYQRPADRDLPYPKVDYGVIVGMMTPEQRDGCWMGNPSGSLRAITYGEYRRALL